MMSRSRLKTGYVILPVFPRSVSSKQSADSDAFTVRACLEDFTFYDD